MCTYKHCSKYLHSAAVVSWLSESITTGRSLTYVGILIILNLLVCKLAHNDLYATYKNSRVSQELWPAMLHGRAELCRGHRVLKPQQTAGFRKVTRYLLSSWVDTLYTFWDKSTHYKTESVNFWGLWTQQLRLIGVQCSWKSSSNVVIVPK